MIRPILEYGCVLFDNCGQTLSDVLESVQYQAARTCAGALRHTNRARLLTDLGWETLAIRRRYFKLVLFYKMFNKHVPPYLSDLVPPSSETSTGRHLRYSHNLRQIKFRTQRFRDSFVPSTIKLWNELPVDIRLSPSVTLFKTKLKCLLFEDIPPAYFAHGQRFPNICQTQLRLGHSVLNYHLCRVNIITDSTCACGFPTEDTDHFILDCPRYANPRKTLLKSVTSILAPGVSPSLLIHLDRNYLLSIMLKGNPDLDIEVNQVIFTAVQHYIAESRRFVF